MNCCRYCGREYADEVTVCPIDQEPLKEAGKAALHTGAAHRIGNWLVILSYRRELMRHPKVLFGAGALMVVLASFGVYRCFFYDFAFRQFEGRDNAYFAQVAKDCDSVLRQYLMGSSALTTNLTARGDGFSIPATSSLLPETLKALHPREVSVSTNGMVLKFGQGWYLHWVLVWGKVKIIGATTPAWTLVSVGESGERPLYTEYKAIQ